MRQYLTGKATRFMLILGGGMVVALAIWVALNVFNIALPGTDTSPLQATIIAPPAAYDWAKEAADRFNAEGHRLNRRPVTIVVSQEDGLSVYDRLNKAALTPMPAAWIADSAFVLDVVNLASRQAIGVDAFIAERPVALSLLMWGGFADRVGVLDARFGGLDWLTVHDASLAAQGWTALGGQSEWGFFKLALPDPGKNSEGLAALLVAAAQYHGKTELSAADIGNAQFQSWAQALIDAVPNFANLGVEPGNALAVRGPSAGDAGMLLEADWLLAAKGGLNNRQPVVLRYAPLTVVFDFTFAVRAAPAGNLETEAERRQREQEVEAARLFRDYLLDAAQQRRAEAFGLRPASGRAANAEGSLFAQWASLGFQTELPASTNLSINADAALAALRWAKFAAGN